MNRVVIDQPGFRIFGFGLVLAIFFGLALSSQISETRVQLFLNKAVDRLQTDMYVDYESAKVNLASWGLPLPALIIKNIRMSPKATSCQNSQVFVDELEIPISFGAIFGFSKELPKLRLKDVELRLTDIDKCLGKAVAKSQPDNSAQAKQMSSNEVTEPKNIFASKTKAELKDIYIEKVKIITSQQINQPLLLKQVSVELLYDNQKLSEVHLKSKMNAFKDARSDVYYLNSNLYAVLKAKENYQVDSVVQINGKFLDGDMKLFANSDGVSKKVNYELAFDRVSLKALAPFIGFLDETRGFSLEKTPASISFVNQGEVFLSGKTSLDSKFKKFLLNIDGGTLSSDEIQIVLNQGRTEIKPFVLDIQNVPMSKIKNLEITKSKLDSFENLGVLSGKLKFTAETKFSIEGDLSGVKAIFSNRGRRDLQNIEKLYFSFIREGEQFKFFATDITINNKKLKGRLDILHHISKNQTSAQLKISKVELSPNIWEQFTFVEQVPNADVNWVYKKIDSEMHDIGIQLDTVKLPGMKLDSLSINLKQNISSKPADNKLVVKIRPGRLEADEEFFKNNYAEAIFNVENGLNFKKIFSDKTNLSIIGSDWKNVKFSLSSTFLSDLYKKQELALIFSGAVFSEKGVVAGVLLQNRGRILKFDVSGTVDTGFLVKAK